ncbi:phosphodiester glycosidase family protein [Deinococcus oregonensis]|uniref:Phosphodiester glycosidase family protein n=1 Tax=Deinococcus oregonensis TaxID=1805970 RepID=A0ABV6B687_9DEIO
MVLAASAEGNAAARPVAIAGVRQSAALETRLLGGVENIAVWTLPRLGVSVRNDPRDVRLLYGNRELRYRPAENGSSETRSTTLAGTGWTALGFALTTPLPAPEVVNGSLHVSLKALQLLGVRLLSDAPDVLDFAAPAVVPTTTLPPSPVATTPTPVAPAPSPRPVTPPPLTELQPLPTPPSPLQSPSIQPIVVQPLPTTPGVPALAHLDTVRVSRTLHRSVEVQRVVLELSAAAPYSVVREKAGLSVTLPRVSATASAQDLPSGDRLSVEPSEAGTTVRLNTGGGTSTLFTLDNPDRVVIDTTTQLDTSVPPPIDPGALAPGITYRQKGMLHLLSFDSALYQPRVVSAPNGKASDVAALVRGVGGVAGVNGGYFDPGSALPVDLVVAGGLMTAPSLERRATIGFTAQGNTLFGYPKPRYLLTGAFGSLTVNSVSSKPRPDLLTAFVGNGNTSVGADQLTTLYVGLGGNTVLSAITGRVTPPAGTLAVTFDPTRFPQLPRTIGQALKTTLSWRADDAPWDTALDALSAGPLLVQRGQVALNPAREMFDTGTNLWRATRQVALGVVGGQTTIAYFEYGTPEVFAAALAAAGVRDAVRLDSGSSATAYLTGGYANLGAYLNTVWSRPVPNAIVFVPRTAPASPELSRR